MIHGIMEYFESHKEEIHEICEKLNVESRKREPRMTSIMAKLDNQIKAEKEARKSKKSEKKGDK